MAIKKKDTYSSCFRGFNREVLDFICTNHQVMPINDFVGIVHEFRLVEFPYTAVACVIDDNWHYKFDNEWYYDWEYAKLLKLKAFL
jgi:hypothetical protein